MVVKDLKLNKDSAPVDGALGPAGSTVESVQLGFSVVSNYETFLTFIRDLQDSLRIIDISRITFNVAQVASEDKKTDPNVVTYAVTIRTYWLP
jgi:hypothetical protein